MKVKLVMLSSSNKIELGNIIKRTNSNIPIQFVNNKLDTDGRLEKLDWKVQHLYFLSDEEIQVGDYYTIYDSQSIHKASGMNQTWYNEMCKKVVATTDTSLNIPLIPQSFVEKYVEKNGVIDEVMIEMVQCFSFEKGKRNLPKIRKDNTVIVSKVKNTWTRDEVIDLLNNMLHQGYTTVPVGEHNCAWKSSGINAALQTSSDVLDQIKLL